jgi:hypothetical protein
LSLLWAVYVTTLRADDFDLSQFEQGTDGVMFAGSAHEEYFGSSVAVCDVNGDGFDDLVVGASGTVVAEIPYAGGAFLVYGPNITVTDQFTFEHVGSDGLPGVKFYGVEANVQCGLAVAKIGNFNGDQFSDFAVGCPYAEEGGTYIIFGSESYNSSIALNTSTAEFLGIRITSSVSATLSGSTLAGGGDINGDMLDDLLIGAPQESNIGAVYVIWGRSSGFSNIVMGSHSSADGVLITVSQIYANFGTTIALANIDGDAYADVVIGAYGKDSDKGVPMTGRVYVLAGYSLLDGDMNLDDAFQGGGSYWISGVGSYEQLGYSVADLGDLNGDGKSELLMAALQRDSSGSNRPYGRAYVVYSAPSYVNLNTSEITSSGPYGYHIIGPATIDEDYVSFRSVANMGDLNGDGATDFAICVEVSIYETLTISVYVVYGTANGANVDLRALTNATGYTIHLDSYYDYHLQLLGTVGDLSGDGHADFALSSPFRAVGGVFEAGVLYIFARGTPLMPGVPSAIPSAVPSAPSAIPSEIPSAVPSAPSAVPTVIPSSFTPSEQPSSSPTMVPTDSSGKLRLASKTYKARNLYAFAALHPEDRTPLAWGAAKLGGNTSSVDASIPLARIVPGTSSFLGITSTGGLLGWGMNSSIAGWTALAGATDIVASSVVANCGAYAGLTTSGAVFAVGSAAVGGNVKSAQWSNGFASQLSYGIASLTPSASSFAALTSWGSVYVWGSKFAAGGVSSNSNHALNYCAKVVATSASFACLQYDGTVTTVGDRYTGGDSTAVTSQLHDVVHIIGAKSTFAAFRADGSLVTWGHPTRGGDSSAVASLLSGGVVHVIYNDLAFAALLADGRVVTWGEVRGGGDFSAVQSQLSYVRSLYATGKAFAALTASGGVVAWGDESNGGVIPSSLLSQLYYGVKEVYATRRAFAALKYDGSVHVWGNAYQGGAAYAVTNYLSSQVNALCANEAAFTAFRSDGTVVAWGHMTVLGFTGGAVVAVDAAYANITQCA